MRDRPDRPRRRPAGPPGRSRPRGPAAATRPVTSRPAAGSGTTTRTSAPRPPSRLTGRAIILGVVLLALAMSYVFPLRVYLSQRAEISELRTSQDAQRSHIAALEAEAARWDDDEYVRIQARRRLHFVEPGETPIIIVWEQQDDAGADPEAGTGGRQDGPWWSTLWSSVEAADQRVPGATGGQPRPTGTPTPPPAGS